MALGDIGLFNPAETHYTTPGAYDELLRGEATKRATYLASMDQFYAELSESSRQFDATLAFKNTALIQDAVLAREGYASSEKIAGMGIKSQEKISADSLKFDYAKLGSEERLNERKLDIAEDQGGNLSAEDQMFLGRYLGRGSSSSGTVSSGNINWGGSGGQAGAEAGDVLFYGSSGQISKDEYDERLRQERGW